MSELVLVNVSGRDKPGLTSEITGIMGRYDVRILDIGQAVIHDHLTWGILIEIPDESKSSPVIRDLLFRLHALICRCILRRSPSRNIRPGPRAATGPATS